MSRLPSLLRIIGYLAIGGTGAVSSLPSRAQALIEPDYSVVATTADTGTGTIGERQTEVAGRPNPAGRIQGRIENRVENRIRNRIDRNFDQGGNPAAPIDNAARRPSL